MLGFEPGWYWRICWTVAGPLFLFVSHYIILLKFKQKSSKIFIEPYNHRPYN